MPYFAKIILSLTSALFLVGFGAFSLNSWQEQEKRAARLSLLMALVGSALFLGFVFLPSPFP